MPDLILVAGASSDLGCALIEQMLRHSLTLKVIAHVHRGAERLQALITEFGERVSPVTADFTDADSVSAMLLDIETRFGVPDQIVYLPALPLRYERLTKFDFARFRRDMAIQVEGPLLLLKKFAPKMSKMPSARMVFVLSSVTRNMPPKYMSMYTTVKYAQLGLMRAAAAEYGGSSLTINAISPSMIETRFVEEIGEVAVRMSAESNPKGRNAVPGDITGAIRFLLSAEAGYLTGVDIPITGGAYI